MDSFIEDYKPKKKNGPLNLIKEPSCFILINGFYASA